VLVDLLGLTVLAEKPPEHTHPPDPDDLLRHTGIASTPPLTDTHVPTLALGNKVLPHAGTRVHRRGLPDDVAILDELADSLAYREKGRVRIWDCEEKIVGDVREFAIEISLTSLGSSQIFF
jgi:hypothetical protein